MQYPWPAQHGAINYISSPPSPQWIEKKRKIVLLGSTGSIGVNALKVILSQGHLFEVIGLAAAFNVQRLAEQAAHFRPPYLAVYDQAGADVLRKLLRPALHSGYTPTILLGQEGYEKMASLEEANTVLSAQVGAAGLRGTVAAAMAGKVIGLANKESLVLAGNLLRHICARSGAVILPVDSEHNALFQMVTGRPAKDIKKLVLTASGGPFREKSKEALQYVTKEQALAHPNWSMGAKISIDSATLMNKGLEVIEAHQLYGLQAEQLDVVIHPQSIVHSLVEYQDNSFMAHLGTPDMRMPIGHCLAWPHCLDVGVKALNLMEMGQLSFSKPDTHAFPCLALAIKALQKGQDACIVLNAANEIAVELFLERRIAFLDIADLVDSALQWHSKNCLENTQNSQTLHIWQEMENVSAVMQHILSLDTTTRHHVKSLVTIQDKS